MSESYRRVREQAEARFGDGTGCRVYIAGGGCGESLGAAAILEAVRSEVRSLGINVRVVEAGCDGACFESPSIWVRRSGGELLRFASVTVESVPTIVREWLANDSRGGEWKGTPVSWTAQSESPFWRGQRRLVAPQIGRLDPSDIDECIAGGGYSALASVLDEVTPAEVVDAVKETDLRGRGGAYFPAGIKWEGARKFPAPRHLVVNAEEGEPGAFKDRHLLEGDPHRPLEGALIAAYAVGVARIYFYVNGQARRSAIRLEEAIAQARERGMIGANVLGSDFDVEVEVRRGAGGYVCGEESVILESIEGKLPVPRLKPPFPTEAGLWGQPTVINNVETLANVPLIWQKQSGEVATVASTKLICLSGSVQRPGLVEVELGTPYRGVVFGIGGGAPEGRSVKGVLAGGPSGGLLPESSLEVEARPGFLHETGAVLGSGGVVVLDDTASIPEVVRRLTDYNARESCGKCTPCREGTPRLREHLDSMADGKDRDEDMAAVVALNSVVAAASLCGLGQMAPNPVRSALYQFPRDFEVNEESTEARSEG